MSDRSKDELRKRFDSPPGDDDDESDGSDPSVSPSSSNTSSTSQTGGGEMDGSSETVKERKQVAMYLPADLREDLGDLYEEFDARSKLAGDGELEKNREFYEALVAFALDRKVEFAAELGIDLDEE